MIIEMPKYIQLTEKCITCAGCNLLENSNFKGKQRCDNYLPLINRKEEVIEKNKSQIY